MASEEIYNYIKVNDDLITGGQPTAEQLKSLVGEGFTMVINLATSQSTPGLEDEAELVRSFDMNYYNIPVEWDNPKQSDFAAFEQTMLNLPNGKTLLHCAANFRVTAFYSLYAQKHLGWSAVQADEFRAAIWKGSDYPVWREFIAQVQSQIPER